MYLSRKSLIRIGLLQTAIIIVFICAITYQAKKLASPDSTMIPTPNQPLDKQQPIAEAAKKELLPVKWLVRHLDREAIWKELQDPQKRSKYVQEDLSWEDPKYWNQKIALLPPFKPGVEKDIEVEFFQLPRYPDGKKVAEEYKRRNLTPVDPYLLFQLNQESPSLQFGIPNGTQWQDANGALVILEFTVRCIDGKALMYHWDQLAYYNGQPTGEYRDQYWTNAWWFVGFPNPTPTPSIE